MVKIPAASKALIGMVSIQAQSKLNVTPHLTADKRFVAPTPMIEPVIVCVVLTGIFSASVTIVFRLSVCAFVVRLHFLLF